MHNPNQRIDEQLSRVRELVEGFKVAGVRTDYVTTSGGYNRRVVHLERHGTRSRYAFVSPRLYQRETGVRSLTSSLGMPADRAFELLDVVEELSELNDMGAWPLVWDPRPAVNVSLNGFNEEGFDVLPMMEDVVNLIRTTMPEVARIEFFTSTRLVSEENRRLGWAQFYDAHGAQVASISTNLLHSAINYYDMGSHEDYFLADRRIGRWAHQLGADQDMFIRAADMLVEIQRSATIATMYLDDR